MTKDFSVFLSQLSETNATLDYFVDFDKVKTNVSAIEVKLNQLNFLIGKEDLEAAVYELFKEAPNSFEVLDILIAIRKNKSAQSFNKDGEIVYLKDYFNSPDKAFEFIVETGLASLFINKNIKNLVDYVLGIEVGLDTNARKNRGGDSMSKAVSLILDNSGVKYESEVNNTRFPEILSFGLDVKRFDFVVRTKVTTYLIEVNYYNSGGSKLNEIARAYSDMSVKINEVPGYEFVWITDGKGWNAAKNKLEEAYGIIPNLYNLLTLEEFVNRVISEEVL